MEFNDCLLQIQGYLENSPLIVLGSGASADYGLPLMHELNEEILNHRYIFDATEFDSLYKNLILMNLEDAIDKTALSDTSLDTLRKIIWQFINKRDFDYFKELLQDKSNFAFADLLKILIQSAPNAVTVVTTNYDRIPEYAVDLIGATATNGFEGTLIRKMEFPNNALQQKRIRSRERVVNIWKVHGSLDWFLKDDGDIVSYPLSENIPTKHRPLIIAPGKGKYNHTHKEPYRDVISNADAAFSKAGSFICIGYGFNDEHIQPKLIEQIKSGKPIVVLCRSATEACKQNVMSTDVKKFVVIEYSSDGKTLISSKNYNNIYDGDFWKLPDFIQAIWGVRNGYL